MRTTSTKRAWRRCGRSTRTASCSAKTRTPAVTASPASPTASSTKRTSSNTHADRGLLGDEVDELLDRRDERLLELLPVVDRLEDAAPHGARFFDAERAADAGLP